jgi:hypothetical protein
VSGKSRVLIFNETEADFAFSGFVCVDGREATVERAFFPCELPGSRGTDC